MVTPPAFKDIGKTVRDVLGDDYCSEGLQLNVSTKTPGGTTFKAEAKRPHATGGVAASLEAKTAWKERGINLSQKFISDKNAFKLNLAQDAKYCKGLKMEAETMVETCAVAEKKCPPLKFTATYGRSPFKAVGIADMGKGTTLTGNFVGSFERTFKNYCPLFIYGAQLIYDVPNMTAKPSFCLGFGDPKHALAAVVNPGKSIDGYIYHMPSATTQWVMNFSYLKGKESVMTIGNRYQLNKNAVFRTKIDNTGSLSLALTQDVKDGVSVTVSATADTKKFYDTGVKCGLKLNFEA